MESTGREPGPRSWTLRVIAPVALVSTALVALLIVVSALDGDSGDDGDRAERTTTTTETNGCAAGEPPAQNAVEDGYYVLEEGEDLTTVEERTCIPVEQLQELNPNLDPLSLPVGGCVDLVVDGCKALAQS
jgi:hypothetical protein